MQVIKILIFFKWLKLDSIRKEVQEGKKNSLIFILWFLVNLKPLKSLTYFIMATILIIPTKEKWDTLSVEKKFLSQETNSDTFKKD